MDLNEYDFEVECENGHKNVVTVGAVSAGERFKCRSCDQMITLKADAQFDSEIAGAQEALDDFKRSSRKFGR